MRLYKDIYSNNLFIDKRHLAIGYLEGMITKIYKDTNLQYVRKYKYIREIKVNFIYIKSKNDKYYL